MSLSRRLVRRLFAELGTASGSAEPRGVDGTEGGGARPDAPLPRRQCNGHRTTQDHAHDSDSGCVRVELEYHEQTAREEVSSPICWDERCGAGLPLTAIETTSGAKRDALGLLRAWAPDRPRKKAGGCAERGEEHGVASAGTGPRRTQAIPARPRHHPSSRHACSAYHVRPTADLPETHGTGVCDRGDEPYPRSLRSPPSRWRDPSCRPHR